MEQSCFFVRSVCFAFRLFHHSHRFSGRRNGVLTSSLEDGAAGSNREHDWAIAMTNYGGLILLDRRKTITEWDTGQSTWLLRNLRFSEWIEKVISEGELITTET